MADLPTQPLAPESEPAQHYDTVVDAWGDLLGEDLHYGYFKTGSEALVEATDQLTDNMLALAAAQADEQVLDIGCGTGKAACRLAGEFSARVIGISPSETCVLRAGELAEREGLADRASFIGGDGTKLAFDDASFDVVWVMESSHLMPDKPALVSEAARVLRKGGRVVLCDIILKRKLALEEVIQYRDDFLLLRDVYGRAIMEPLAFYRAEFESSGLKVTHETDITAETFKTFEHWRTNALQNKAAVIEQIGERSWQQFLLSCDVLEKFWQEDILGYGIISATTA